MKNTFSGTAGELRVAAELVRHGFRVAKPYWGDNETDLIILCEHQAMLIPIAVQVKSVQFLKGQGKVFISGLKRRYLRNGDLVLVVYNPEKDGFVLHAGSEKIEHRYRSQCQQPKHKSFDSLESSEDVRISYEEADFKPACPIEWSKEIHLVRDRIASQKDMVAQIKAAMGW